MDGWLAERNQLAERINNGRPAPAVPPTELPWSDILVCDDVFQHRSGNLASSEAHTRELTKVLERNPQKPLAPILVFWVGDKWCCIDGHHRINAYRMAIYRQPIPVQIYSGTLDQAIAKALHCNSRDKLPMARVEKSEAAWRLVVGTELSKALIASAASISERTVAYMREAAKKIRVAHPDRALDSLRWRDADRIAKGLDVVERDFDDDWKRSEAQILANRLSKTFGPRFGRNPEVTAMAIEIYSQPLFDALAEFIQPVDDDEIVPPGFPQRTNDDEDSMF